MFFLLHIDCKNCSFLLVTLAVLDGKGVQLHLHTPAHAIFKTHM